MLETLFYIDFTPDIINCNDWQTALVPVYLNLYYRHLDKFNRIKTIFCHPHNIAYQGQVRNQILRKTPAASAARDQHIVEYDGCANFMKVPSRRQTRSPQSAPPMHWGDPRPVVRLQVWTLCCARSITNSAASWIGIDMEANGPATDDPIAFNYDVSNFRGARQSARRLCRISSALNGDGSPSLQWSAAWSA